MNKRQIAYVERYVAQADVECLLQLVEEGKFQPRDLELLARGDPRHAASAALRRLPKGLDEGVCQVYDFRTSDKR